MKKMILLLLMLALVSVMLTSCETTSEPSDGKLPFGVFPLKDVKWVYKVDEAWPGHSPIYVYDSDSICIGVVNYDESYIVTLSVRQLSKNEAELHSCAIATATNRMFYPNQYGYESGYTEVSLPDSTLFEANKIQGQILLEDKKVFLQREGVSEIRLFYDFTLNVGDTFLAFPVKSPMNVTSIDSILVGDEYRKRYNFADYDGKNTFFVIEGIGIGNEKCSFFHTISGTLNTNNSDNPDQHLIGVYYQDELIYETDKIIKK